MITCAAATDARKRIYFSNSRSRQAIVAQPLHGQRVRSPPSGHRAAAAASAAAAATTSTATTTIATAATPRHHPQLHQQHRSNNTNHNFRSHPPVRPPAGRHPTGAGRICAGSTFRGATTHKCRFREHIARPGGQRRAKAGADAMERRKRGGFSACCAAGTLPPWPSRRQLSPT